MKKTFIFLLFMPVIFLSIHAQTIDSSATDQSSEIFTVVDVMPEFSGGQDALNNFLGANIQYPVMAKEQGIQGKVYASFIVDQNGKISNIKIIKGIGSGCDEEVLRVLKLMPAWKPGKYGEHNVKVMYKLPVSFILR